ncbi:MAG: hypothetical protein COB36_10010 [Alphaproteobacteria bacterium]|nr:MAG: hypothetical protein COB36_10010 [Alphaproteobacteria bacterium]
MKIVRTAVILLSALLSTISHAQSLDEAVEFIYCGDGGWANCPFSAELEDCNVLIESVKIDNGIINGTLKFRIHFNNFIWRSAVSNAFSNNLSVSCVDECVEDLNGNLGDYYLLVLGSIFDKSSYMVGFNAAPSRVLRAIDVIEKNCPGVQSSF